MDDIPDGWHKKYDEFWNGTQCGVAMKQKLKSVSFPDGGFYIMRHGDLFMILDCVPFYPGAPSGHKHNSRLSFELFAYDKSFIIDPGTCIYTADKEMRNLFRSTRYHNTVVVDCKEQNRFDEDDLFSLKPDSFVKMNRWISADKYDLFDGEHRGYARLKYPVIHRRRIRFNKEKGYWVIKDTLVGEGEHNFSLYFHFAPLEIELDKDFPLVAKTRTKGANLAIIPLEIEGVTPEILDGWVSYRYGIKMEAPIVRYSKKCHVPTSFCNIIYPYKEDIDISMIRQNMQYGESPEFGSV